MTDMTHADPDGRRQLKRWQVIGACVLVCTVAAILVSYGAAASYQSLSHLAAAKSVPLPRLNPIGLDGGLVGIVALDIILTWAWHPIGWLRFTARLFAAGTLAANAAAGWPDPIGVFLRIFAPALVVIISEAVRTVLLDRAREGRDAIPLARWILAPLPTFRLWRRMVLGNLTDYPRAVELEAARLHARDLIRAASESDRTLAIPAALHRSIRTGRLPASVVAAVDSGLRFGGASQWEPEVASWVTSRLTLSDRLAAQLRDERNAIAAPVPGAAPEPIAGDVPDVPQEVIPEAPPAPIRKPSAAAVKKMSGTDLAPYVETLLDRPGGVTLAWLMKHLHVGEPKAREALRIAKGDGPQADVIDLVRTAAEA